MWYTHLSFLVFTDFGNREFLQRRSEMKQKKAENEFKFVELKTVVHSLLRR